MITIPDMRISTIPDNKWQLELAPKFLYECETAPCWFHRVMLKLILGFTWRRINTTKDTNND